MTRRFVLLVDVTIEGDADTVPALPDVVDQVSEAIRDAGMEYRTVRPVYYEDAGTFLAPKPEPPLVHYRAAVGQVPCPFVVPGGVIQGLKSALPQPQRHVLTTDPQAADCRHCVKWLEDRNLRRRAGEPLAVFLARQDVERPAGGTTS